MKNGKLKKRSIATFYISWSSGIRIENLRPRLAGVFCGVLLKPDCRFAVRGIGYVSIHCCFSAILRLLFRRTAGCCYLQTGTGIFVSTLV